MNSTETQMPHNGIIFRAAIDGQTGPAYDLAAETLRAAKVEARKLAGPGRRATIWARTGRVYWAIDGAGEEWAPIASVGAGGGR